MDTDFDILKYIKKYKILTSIHFKG